MRNSLASILLLAVLGCVSAEHAEVRAARAAHERCTDEKSATDPECVALHEQLLDAQRRYEERARHRWGCNPAEEECPAIR